MNKHLLRYTLSEQTNHGKKVASLAYHVAKELGCSKDFCDEMAIAGLLHDIGKTVLQDEMAGENPLMVEEMRCIRRHPEKSYEMLKKHNFSDLICDSVLYHHENLDGSGYPSNLEGDSIPLGSCILRVCDVYSALTDKRAYRDAYPEEEAMRLLIKEVKNFRMDVFLAFQRVVHNGADGKLTIPKCPLDLGRVLQKLYLSED